MCVCEAVEGRGREGGREGGGEWLAYDEGVSVIPGPGLMGDRGAGTTPPPSPRHSRWRAPPGDLPNTSCRVTRAGRGFGSLPQYG